MKRLALLLLVVGCTDARDTDSRPTTDAERAFVAEALPVLQTNCVSCHANQADPGIAFLAGDTWEEIRATVLESSVIADPVTSSRLLTKGAHSGPNLNNEETAKVLAWLEAERP